MAIELANKLCTGCTACAKVCPKQCITMKPNVEGFVYPEIDTSVCAQCGLCEKTCPVLHKPTQEAIETVAFAAYSTDLECRLASSSGGIFSLLANEVLNEGGIVFGAAFDDCFNVHHIGVETKDELGKLRGSKYVQSSLGNVFDDVKRNLDNGRMVLFSGVICQIAGLKSYLKKDYPNLLAVDVLCHGVPSPKLWKKYIDELEKTHGGAVRRMFFRHKKYGWKTYAVSFEFSNDTAYERIFSKDPFMQMFLQNICLRLSCHNCQFNELDRLSDITLGDCWGIDRIMPDMDDDKGTSVVLVHTEKGKAYFNRIKSMTEIRESDVDKILPPSSGGRHAVAPHRKRASFFAEIDSSDIPKLAKMVEPSFFVKARSFAFMCGGRILRVLHIKR